MEFPDSLFLDEVARGADSPLAVGAANGERLLSFACAVEVVLAAALRVSRPPVLGIVCDGRLVLDSRAFGGGEVDEATAVVGAARG